MDTSHIYMNLRILIISMSESCDTPVDSEDLIHLNFLSLDGVKHPGIRSHIPFFTLWHLLLWGRIWQLKTMEDAWKHFLLNCTSRECWEPLVQTSSTHEVLFIEVPQEVSGLKVIIFEGLGKHFFLKLMQLLNHNRVTRIDLENYIAFGFCATNLRKYV